MSSLASFYRTAFTEHSDVPVEAPWPFGDKRAILWVRPHFVSPFVEAVAALGIAPPETLARRYELRQETLAAQRAAQAKEMRLDLAKSGQTQTAAMRAVVDMLDTLAAAAEDKLPTPADLEGWDLRYPVYLREEVEALAPMVGLHLVSRGGLVPKDWTEADGEADFQPWSGAEIAALFAETEPIPAVYPDDPGATVPFAGVPEGVVWATLCLRTAVRKHLYLERAIPLDYGLPAEAPSAATLLESERSPTGSLPG